MSYYPVIVTFHIVFVGIWLANFLFDFYVKGRIKTETDPGTKNKLIKVYLGVVSLFANIGSIGVLLTGLLLVVLNPGYGFFDFSANHWLATKQIVMVIILLIVFIKFIPASKQLKAEVKKSGENGDNTGTNTALAKLYSLNMWIHILVIINFLFALTRNFVG